MPQIHDGKLKHHRLVEFVAHDLCLLQDRGILENSLGHLDKVSAPPHLDDALGPLNLLL